MKYEFKSIEIPTKIFKWIEGISDDGTIISIPMDPLNSDYQAYLAHVDSEGNK